MKEYIEREEARDLMERALEDDWEIKYANDRLRDIPAADVVPGRDFRDCRNELCLRCGEYKMRHKGACDGCRWRDA